MSGLNPSAEVYNPNGLVIQAQGFRGDQRQKCITHCQRAHYATLVVLDDFTLAMDLLPYAKVVIYRDYNFEPEPGDRNHNVAQLRNFLAHLPKDPRAKQVVIYVNNEQPYTEARLSMYADMIEAIHPEGWRLCVGNWSSGSGQSGMGGEPNGWLIAKRLLEVMARCPGHYMGIHEYTTFFLWAVCNGLWPVGREAWEMRPTAIDWTRPQWHIGRCYGLVLACEQLDLPCPDVVITECFLDDMDDIAWAYGNRAAEDVGIKIQSVDPHRPPWAFIGDWIIAFVALVLKVLSPGRTFTAQARIPSKKAKGWQSLIPQWAIWYPGKDPGLVYAEMCIWAMETVYSKILHRGRRVVVGGCVYTYCDASGEPELWWSFRVDNSPAYLQRQEQYTEELRGHVVTAPEEQKPMPTIPAPGEYTIKAPEAKNVRVQPTTKAGWDVFQVKSGQHVVRLPDAHQVADSLTWIKILIPGNPAGQTEGWIALSQGLEFIPVVKPAPQPESEPIPAPQPAPTPTPEPAPAPVPPPETTTPVPPVFLPVLAFATAQEFQEAIAAGETLVKHLQTWLDRAKQAQKETVL